MNPKPLIYLALVASIILLTSHSLAGVYHLYWSYWWFDVLMHFWGGLTVGLVASWAFLRFRPEVPYNRSMFIVAVLAAVLVVGSAWEVFEYLNKIIGSHEAYTLDVVNDLTLDAFGALAAAAVALRKRHG